MRQNTEKVDERLRRLDPLEDIAGGTDLQALLDMLLYRGRKGHCNRAPS